MNVTGRKNVLHKALSVILAFAMILGNMVTGNFTVIEAAEEHTCTYVNGICTDSACTQPYEAPEGDGSKDNPYQIGNAGELYYFAGIVNGDETICTGEDGAPQLNVGAYGQLTADITVNSDEVSGGSVNAMPWTPIGNWNNTFKGVFDGQNHTISGLYCKTESQSGEAVYVGLFGVCGGATIQNVGLLNSYIYAGGAGNGQNYAGGVCGYATPAVIRNCYTNVIVESEYCAGGLVGNARGDNNGMNISNCYVIGSVEGNENVTGAIMGYYGGSIEKCYYLDTISSAIGKNFNVVVDAKSRTLEQFASGQVAYELNGDQTEIVWGQTLSGEAVLPEDTQEFPVLSGEKVCVKGNAVCPGSEVTGTIYFNGTEDDVEYQYKNHNCDVNAENPYLCVECHQIVEHDCLYVNGICKYCDGYEAPEGDGSEESPYRIDNAGKLYYFAALVNGDESVCTGEDGAPQQNTDAWAQLTADIVLNEGIVNDVNDSLAQWTPIGNKENIYTGTFDGQNHTISGLYINNTESFQGLFGMNTGTIKNLGVINSYVAGEWVTGSLVAGNSDGTYDNPGTVSNCYSTAIVKGSDYAGGLVGTSGIIQNSYFAGICTDANGPNGMGGGIEGFDYNSSEESFTTYSRQCENCYFVSGNAISADIEGVKARTLEQFASGQVAYELNGDQTKIVWGQTLSGAVISGEEVTAGAVQALPVLGGLQVYQKMSKICPGIDDTDESVVRYNAFTNNQEEAYSYTYAEHDFESKDDGIKDLYDCQQCGLPREHDCEYENGICILCDGYEKPAGEGTKAKPYELANAGNLIWYAEMLNEAYVNDELYPEEESNAGNAVLTKDIYLNPEGVTAGSVDVCQWNMIEEYPEDNLFDGQGYTIHGLCYNGSDNFAFIGSNYGEIMNVTFAGVSIINDGEQSYAGAVSVTNYETIDHVTVLGQIEDSGSDSVGGISAENYDTIRNCTNYAKVSGESGVGGISGYNRGTIQNCTNYGNIEGSYNVGGICGTDWRGTAQKCVNHGKIYGDSYAAGGIVGCGEENTIKVCANYGDVNSDELAGGIAAELAGSSEILLCYNTGNITAETYYAGGIVACFTAASPLMLSDSKGITPYGAGNSAGSVISCYNLGQIQAGDCCGKHVAGGIIGDAENINTVMCYYLEGSADIGIGIDIDEYCEDYENMLAFYVENDGIKKVKEEDFRSGELTWSMNEAAGETGFYQTLTGEAVQLYPELEGELVVRYGVFGCKGQTTPLEATYSNGEKDTNIYLFPNHNYDKETHVCKYCLKANDKHVCTYDKDGICTSCKGIKLPEGTGTSSDPYQIATATQLRWFAGVVNGDENICKNGIKQNKKACAVLVDDIVLNEVSVEAVDVTMEDMMDGKLPAMVNGAAVWTPIGTYKMPDISDMMEYLEFLINGMNSMGYNGTFDGQGHSISGVYIYEMNPSEDYLGGLFGLLGANGIVKNVEVIDSNITVLGQNGSSYAAGIAGGNYGTISKCSYEGDVLTMIGAGITATNLGSVKDCTFDGKIIAVNGAGIVSENEGQLERCAAYGTIMGYQGAAGIACESTVDITACYNQAKVSGDVAAGIVAEAEEILVKGCYNTGIIEGNVAGPIMAISDEENPIVNSYYLDPEAVDVVTEGAVTGEAVDPVYSDGEPVSPERMASGEITWKLNNALGKKVYGQTLTGEMAELYPVFDGSTVYAVGVASCPGVEVQDALSYSNDSSQIQYEYEKHLYEDGRYICSFCDHVKEHTCQYENGYCILCSKLQKPEGNGTVEVPYEIANEAELKWFAAKVSGMLDGEVAMPDAHAVLTDDIELTEPDSEADAWKPIGYNGETGTEYPYNGTFDGKGHSIGVAVGFSTNMRHLGFFTSIGERGIVRNLNIDMYLINQPEDMGSPSMSGSTSMERIGVFGSINKGIIENCAVGGRIELYNSSNGYMPISTHYIGGFCGINEGTIDRCRNLMERVAVYNGNAGGICGMNYGTITNSYNMAEISTYIGMAAGLVSTNYGRLAYSYNMGVVSSQQMPAVGLCCMVMEGGCVEYCYAPMSLEEIADEEFGNVAGNVVNSSYMPDEMFENGTLTYTYNQLQGEKVFGQVLSGEAVSPEDVHAYPSLSGPAVYPKEMNCPGEFSGVNFEAGFTNDANYTVTYTYPNHYYGDEDEYDYCDYCMQYKTQHTCEYENGICTTCEMFEKPEGEGTKENPYKISNYGELCYFANMVDGSYNNMPNPNACAVLVNDITANEDLDPQKQLDEFLEEELDENEVTEVVSEDAVELNVWWTVGENTGVTYEGTLDGGYHTISGLYCHPWNTDLGALFYRTGKQAVIKNLAVDNSLLVGARSAAGIALRNGGTIDNCSVNGIIYSSGYGAMALMEDYELSGTIGGLCSFNTGTIRNSWVDARIDLGYWDSNMKEYPAICFDNTDGMIDNCYYTVPEDNAAYQESLEENGIRIDKQSWDGITYMTKEDTAAGTLAWALDTCAGETDRKNIWGQSSKTGKPGFVAAGADAVTLLMLKRLDQTVEEYYVTKNSDMETILANSEDALWVYNGRQCGVEDGTVFAGDVLNYGILALREEVAPTGTITIGDKTWDSFKDVTAFETRQVKNTAVNITTDGKAVKTEYLVYQVENATGSGLTMEELEGMEFALYDENTNLTVGDNGYVVIYVRLTDANGIINYISTDGLVIIDEIPDPKPSDDVTPSPGPTGSPEPSESHEPTPSPTGSCEPGSSGSESPNPGPSTTPQPSGSENPQPSESTSPEPSGSEDPNPGPSISPEPTDTPTPGPSPEPGDEVMKGDVNDNGKVELSDAQMALKMALKIIANPTEQQVKAADVNNDGKVALADAQKILKVALKIETF